MFSDNIKSSIFLFKYSLVKRNTKEYYRELLKNQFLSPDELDALNWTRTNNLLQYAYHKVPYYKRRFDAIGLHPDDITNPEDYTKVPLLTREDLQKHFQELVSTEARPQDIRLSTTGGSTGEPVKVYHEKKVVRAATGWRMLSWWGINPGNDFASVYRDTKTDLRSRIMDRLMWWPTRKIQLNATSLEPASMERFLEQFRKVKPSLLHGYVGAVDHLASYVLDHKLSVPAPKAIWVTSSPLSAVQEKRIEQAFHAPVYDQYGCCEIYWLASQCPEKGPLHMFGDIRRFEFLDDQNRPCPSGELGKIVVTDLENYLFPLIRYVNGDRGRSVSGRCSCGVTLPLMDKVKGRITDMIRLPNGTAISGDYMTTIFDDVPDAVRQFQVYQKADFSIEILVVPNPTFDGLGKVLEDAAAQMTKAVKDTVPVAVREVAEIPQKGGKLRFVRSDLA